MHMSSECHKPIIIYDYIYESDEISQIYISNILGVYRKKKYTSPILRNFNKKSEQQLKYVTHATCD